MNAIFERLVERLRYEAARHYGDRLVSLAVYGSVGRGTAHRDSDIDFVIVARDLPNGRGARLREFGPVEAALAPDLRDARKLECHIELSPIFKTPDEVEAGSLIFLDMTEDARILHDESNYFADFLRRFRARLDTLGARRIWKGNAWIWDLKPDYRPGEIFEI